MCMMQMQAVIYVNATQAWFGRSGYFKGLSKHASKTQTEYTGA